jgi:hypothetical protein
LVSNRVIHEDATALGAGQWCEAASSANDCRDLALGSEHPVILWLRRFGGG